jgi:hypothetical protein
LSWGGEPLVDGLKNNRGLLGEELLDIAGMFLEGMSKSGRSTSTLTIGDGQKLSKESCGFQI